jgi:hypothetical protein
MLVVGEPKYPSDEWPRIIGYLFVGAAIGYTVRVLLDRLFVQVDAVAAAERRLRSAGAHELHDDVVQDLTAAQLALKLGDTTRVAASLEQALRRTQAIVGRLLSPLEDEGELTPGSLRRTTPPAEDEDGRSAQPAPPGLSAPP